MSNCHTKRNAIGPLAVIPYLARCRGAQIEIIYKLKLWERLPSLLRGLHAICAPSV